MRGHDAGDEQGQRLRVARSPTSGARLRPSRPRVTEPDRVAEPSQSSSRHGCSCGRGPGAGRPVAPGGGGTLRRGRLGPVGAARAGRRPAPVVVGGQDDDGQDGGDGHEGELAPEQRPPAVELDDRGTDGHPQHRAPGPDQGPPAHGLDPVLVGEGLEHQGHRGRPGGRPLDPVEQPGGDEHTGRGRRRGEDHADRGSRSGPTGRGACSRAGPRACRAPARRRRRPAAARSTSRSAWRPWCAAGGPPRAGPPRTP